LRLLILYTELAGYVLGNYKQFLDSNPDAELLVIHYPVNPEAPFNFESFQRTKFIVFDINKANSIGQIVLNFRPDAVLCSGWSNSIYLDWVKDLDKHVKKVICFDNQWNGNLKQRLLSLFSRFTFLKMFQFAWVPGEPQKKYATKIGFNEKDVFTGLYPADSKLFIPIGKHKLSNKGIYPKVILSVARYIPQKDLPTMWNAFIEANQETDGNWSMQCIGFGEQFDQRLQHASISHLGFKQPTEIETYASNAGVYVLPSTYEPWGVAVHEMALSALPMVLSDKVGAATMFLNKSNGYSFPAGDKEKLKDVFKIIMTLSDQQLWEMAEASYRSGLQLSSDDWASTLHTILKK
jgi:glycosyltransferase involved in cell wall biosynthesis